MPEHIWDSRRLRIAVDGYNFAMPKGTGVATYGFTLARMLKEMGHQVEGIFGLDVGETPEMRETMLYDLVGRERTETRKLARKRVRKEKLRAFMRQRLLEVPVTDQVLKEGLSDRIPSFDRIWSSASLFEAANWHFRYFKTFLKIELPQPPDVMHWTYPIPVHLMGSKNIYTLHDIVPLKMPYLTLDDKEFYYSLVKNCVNSGAGICTVSQTSLDDIVSRFPVARGRIFNTYQSSPVPTDVLTSDPTVDSNIIEQMYSLRRGDYFLFFGALDPKKNIARIIEAYLSSGAKSPLVIVSARNWGMTDVANGGSGITIHGRAISSERIIQLDYMPRALLFRLIRCAKAVLMPSLFEGFGLPALEAIQLGTPVIASNTGSLPEVVGNAGLLVDPYDVAEIAAAIEGLDSNISLRDRLISAGKQQSQMFSDARYKERLSDLYSSILRE
ncbi:glycosyltransferase family 4 protein [Sphingobium sp. MI1205]|uniref:glycosyltransferase family 4 protein n=1 Tax=Sphingobium sp. MI1205 TaxID=407020 RepID=UPI0007705EB8|nr:glycosyltransferase family 1 protein [Sphingobium sp. MI1205]AMK18967.1 group 1 glycosyl transferase [Sphingobium sp. MI1205]